MGKLLEIVGQEEYDKLKSVLGTEFERVEGLFDVEQVLLNKNGEYIRAEDASVVLEDGWLGEDGSVDLEKVTDERLKEYISKLETQIDDNLKKTDEVLIGNAISVEAEKQGIIDVGDVVRFLEYDKIKVEDGKVVGVVDAIGELKGAKPYLFKAVEGGGGFNPAKGLKETGYRQGMTFDEAYSI